MSVVRILIVEEDASQTQHLEKLLDDLGYSVTATSGEEIPGLQPIAYSREQTGDIINTPGVPTFEAPAGLAGIAIFDAQGICRYVNPIAASWLSGQPADFAGKTCREIFPEPQASQLQTSLKKAIQNNLGESSETQIVAGNELRWVSLTIQPILAANGTARMASLKLIDINERKLASAALLKSEERFRALIEKSAELIVVIDATGLIQFASPAVKTIMGYDPQAVLGSSFLDWIHPEDLPQARLSLESRSRTPGTAPSSLVVRCRHQNGEWRTLEALGTNLLAEPAVQGIVLNVRDISLRLEAETALTRHIQELTALNELGRRVNISLSVDQVLNAAVDEILKAVQPDAAILFMRSEGSASLTLQEIYPAAARERFGQIPEHHLGEGLCGMAIQQGLNLYSHDIFNDKRCTGSECKKSNLTAFAALPIRNGEEIIAVLGLSSIMPRDFEQQDTFLGALLHQVSIALQNARLYEKAQREIEERRQLELELRQSEERYRNLFEDSPISLWEEDFSLVRKRLTAEAVIMKEQGISDYSAYLAAHPEFAAECASLARVTAVNRATLELFHAPDRQALLKNLSQLLDAESLKLFSLEIVNLLEGKTFFGWEGKNTTFDGQEIEVNLRWAAAPGCEESLSRVIISMIDITERKQTEEKLLKRSQEIKLLYNASLELSRSMDPVDTYHVLERQISTLMDCDSLFISVYNPETGFIRCVGAFIDHKPQDVSSFPALPLEPEGRGTQSRVIRSAQAWLINDFQREIQSSSSRHYINEHGQIFEPEQVPEDADITRSGLILPLLLQEQVQGVIQILSYDINAYSQESLNLAQALAAQFAIANNNALLYHAAQIEIAERKLAEQALRESEERYRLLFENVPVGISVNAHGKTLFANLTAARLLGATTQEQVIGLPNENVIHPSTFPATQARMQRLLNGENVEYPVEDLYMRLDGSTVPVEVTGARITFQGEPALLIIYSDISQRKAAAQALLEAHAQLEERVRERTAEVQDLYDNAPCGYYSLDAEGRFVHINKTQLDWMGYERQDVIGHVFTEFMTHHSQDEFLRTFADFKRSGSLKNSEIELICKDGTILSLLANSTAVFDEGGGFKMSRSTLLDISLRKRAEQALRESEARLRQNRDELSAANKALEKAARLKDEFLASMSHELRTPLTGILGLSEAMQLETYGELSERQLRTLKNIEKSGRHLLELINDILDLSKIEAGKFDLQFEPCSLSEVCQASLQLIRGMAEQKKQKVEFSMEPANLTVHADRRRLKQMLVNLLSNAIKFSPDGGKLGMEIRSDETGKQARICIWDQGIGIQKDDLPRLFEPFSQLDSSLSRQYAGTGLGISLVKRMVELHHGSINVESVPGQGSRFTLSLPIMTEVTATTASAKTFSTRPRRALICDDNLVDAEQAARYLQNLGIASTQQSNPAFIANQSAQEQPDLILMELNLPEKSGLDVLAELRADKRFHYTPVVIISVEEKRRKAVSMGAAGYLVKPFTQAELRTELENIFRVNIEPISIPSVAVAPLVLIADDNEENLQMLADFLESRHYQIDKARNGLEMLERAAQKHPKIILVDVQMPEMDGLEAMRRIRADQDPQIADIPMIAITALAMPGDRERCLSAGANHYMSKPLQLGMLVGAISSLINPAPHAQP